MIVLSAAEVDAAIDETHQKLLKLHEKTVDAEMSIREAGLAPRVEWMRLKAEGTKPKGTG